MSYRKPAIPYLHRIMHDKGDCSGKACGADDGMGGMCLEGHCPAGQVCSSWKSLDASYFIGCVLPNCIGKACGVDNGFGEICKTGNCPGNQFCNNGVCESTF